MFGFGSAAGPVDPDARGTFDPLEHVMLEFYLGWAPDTVRQLLFADESRFTMDCHLKVQDARGGVASRWTADGDRERREVTFQQRIDSPLSPVRSSNCVWSQWLLLDRQQGLVFELKSDLLNVPFGDAWSLYWRWIFRPSEVGRASHVTLSTQVVFVKYLVWKSQVQAEGVRAGKEMAPVLQQLIKTYMLEHQPASMPRRMVRLMRTLPENSLPAAAARSEQPPPQAVGSEASRSAALPAAVASPHKRANCGADLPPRRARRCSSVEAAIIAASLEELAKLTPRQHAQQEWLWVEGKCEEQRQHQWTHQSPHSC